MSAEPMSERFARLTTPDVDRAVAAAYALMATADGDESATEKARLQTLLGISSLEDESTTPESDAEALVKGVVNDAFALADRMLTDFDGASRIASARLKALFEKGADEDARLLIVDVARALIVADGVLEGKEEAALAAIAKDLGLPNVEY